MVQNIFIVGSKGIPGAYGGYETFVDKLTEYHQNEQCIRYHVACMISECERLGDYVINVVDAIKQQQVKHA